jgi:S-disulfanyl-L-cysteine oxidoreductase SoxD
MDGAAMRSLRWLVIVAAGSFAVACGVGEPAAPGGSRLPSASASPAPPPAAVPSREEESLAAPSATFAQQVIAGKALFADSCAVCHGSAGQGRSATRLVGMTSGALSRFGTAEELADFVMVNMPPNAASRLSQAEYYDVVGFLLSANGVATSDRVLDEAIAPTVNLR